jgi:hypothetical protein
VPLGDAPAHEVREFLLEHMKEIEHHESLAHKLLEYFGF